MIRDEIDDAFPKPEWCVEVGRAVIQFVSPTAPRRVVRAARWIDPPDVKKMFGTADILRDGRVVFDIGGNKYRLVVWINYACGFPGPPGIREV